MRGLKHPRPVSPQICCHVRCAYGLVAVGAKSGTGAVHGPARLRARETPKPHHGEGAPHSKPQAYLVP